MTRKIPYAILILILITSFSLMLSVSVKESATMDELAHIPAGYGYLRYLDYRLNPEHPPLVKVLSSIPLLFIRPNFPLAHSSWSEDVNGQWAVGDQFLYHSGNDADRLIFWGRLGPIILALLLAVLIFIWAKESLGEKWALLPTFLFAFSPTVLAHGHYVTTDIGAAFGVVSATYFFIKFLLKPTGRNLVFAGLTFGLAQLMKFTVVFLVPYFLILTLVWGFRSRRFWRYFLSLIIIFLIGLFLIYLVYFIFTLNYPISKQVADTDFLLSSLKHRWLAELNVKMAGNKFSRPLAQYFLGLLMAAQRSAHGNTAYFLGKISASGWWYYFPVVFLLKEPIPSLVLIGLALLLSVGRILKAKSYKLKAVSDYLGTHFPEFSMLAFVIFYWLYSINSSLNIGIRHILPTIPFIYILATSGLKNWVNSRYFFRVNPLLRNINPRLSASIIMLFLFWYLLETVWAYPFYLSYFNQFGGGVSQGYRYVTDSNYDWGQDLKRLAVFVKNPPADRNIKKIAVDYFGGGDSQYYLGEKAEPWWSARGNPKDIGIEWLAVSINTLQGALAKPVANFQRNPEDEYRWLQELRNPFQPDFRAGTSIFIYKL